LNKDVDEGLLKALPGSLRSIAEVAGLEATLKIAYAFRCTILYIPALDELTRQFRDETMRCDYDKGVPVRSLAIRFGISERRVRKILNRPSKQPHPLVYRLLDEQQKTRG
jgi:Mor family transcriptional regulator